MTTISFADQFYILTLSDLYQDPKNCCCIKLSKNKEFVLQPYSDGYIWTCDAYKPDIEDCNVIVAERSGLGLSGTYWSGSIPRTQGIVEQKIYKFWDDITVEAEDPNEFNSEYNEYYFKIDKLKTEYTFEQVKEDEDDENDGEDEDDENEDKKRDIECYNNFPCIFYLNTFPNLNSNDLKIVNKVQVNHQISIYDVIYGDQMIGKAVLSSRLMAMNGEQAGIALYSTESEIQAFGNFEIDDEWYDIAPALTQSDKKIKKIFKLLYKKN